MPQEEYMLYITGDTHGDLARFDERMRDKGLTKYDILLVTGDFGFDWNLTMKRKWQDYPHEYTVVFCDGNHENFDILNSLPSTEMFGDTVGDFGNNTYRLLTGHMYDIAGYRTFVFGGAASIDAADRIPWVSWWPDEIPKKFQIDLAMKTLEQNMWRFDLFVSHTCSQETKKRIGIPMFDFYDPTEKMIGDLEKEILEHGGEWGSSWFGHFHKDVNIDGKWHCRMNRVSRILDRTRFENIGLKVNRRQRGPQMELGF